MSFLNDFPHVRQYDGDLGWLIRKCASIDSAVAALEEWKENADIGFTELRQLLDNIALGIFPEEIADAIRKWIVQNFYDIVGDMTKMVFFGLTDSGYFVAYIPESWDDIDFKTTGWDVVIDIMQDYGHLVLEY